MPQKCGMLSQHSLTSHMSQETPTTGGRDCIHLWWDHTGGRGAEIRWPEHTPQCSLLSLGWFPPSSVRILPSPPATWHNQALRLLNRISWGLSDDKHVTANVLADKSRSPNIICKFRPSCYNPLTEGWSVSFLMGWDIGGDNEKNQAKQDSLKSVKGGQNYANTTGFQKSTHTYLGAKQQEKSKSNEQRSLELIWGCWTLSWCAVIADVRLISGARFNCTSINLLQPLEFYSINSHLDYWLKIFFKSRSYAAELFSNSKVNGYSNFVYRAKDNRSILKNGLLECLQN